MQLSFRIFVISIFFISFSHANGTLEKELSELEIVQEKINLKREWARFRYDSDVQKCREVFFSNRCILKAKKILQNEDKDLSLQETALHDRQREVKKAIKDEQEYLRAQERSDPKNVEERAKNRAAYQEKQQQKLEREAELEERRKESAKRAEANRNTSPF